MKIVDYLIIFIVLFSSLSIGQSSGKVTNVGTTAASFLEIGVGARAIGMGGAFVATANDITAIYWNPAGLGRLERAEVLFVHTNWIADIAYDFVAASIPLGRYGTVGASITTLSMDDMEVRTEDYPEGTGEFFNARDLAMTLSYGFKITDRFSIGFNGKFIHQQIWEQRAQGFALDIGTLFTTTFNGLRIGAAMTNFGSDMKMDGENLLVYHDIDQTKLGNNDRIFAKLETNKWPIPLNFQAGLAMEVLNSRLHRLTVATEATHPSDNTESVHLGLEYALREMFFLRGGYRDLFLQDSEEGFTLGAGFSSKFFGKLQVFLDYAYADFGRLENAQRFSIILRF